MRSRFRRISRTIRVAALSLLAPAAAFAEPVAPRFGDTFCAGYDARTNTCATLGTVAREDGTLLTGAEAVEITIPGMPDLTLRLQSQSRRVEGRYCLVEGSVTTSAEPADHPYGTMLRFTLGAMMTGLARRGACWELHLCGDEMAAIMYLDGVPKQEFSSVSTFFRNDDPRAAAIRTRKITLQELATSAEEPASECIPVG